ncbi:MAG: restriction endonuclease subunit S [Candidatus Methylumidiphilus sp.]
MLEGLEVSEVMYSKVDLGDRYDAEYFWKDSLHIQELLEQKGSVIFDKFGDFVASAFYPAATHLYESGDTPFIRCVDCIGYPLITNEQNELFEKIPLSFAHESGGINLLKKGDFVITKVGSPCYASIIEEHELVALSRTVLGVKNIRNVDPYYLLVFLRSRYGFNQLLRQRELTIQYQLTLARVKNIQIYIAEIGLQQKIREIVITYTEKQYKSQSLYAQAETLLLNALGMADFSPSTENVNVKSFEDSFLATGRLDAEHYQTKYEQVEEKIRGYPNGFATLGEISPNPTNGVEIREYCETGTPYLRIGDIKQLQINEKSLVFVEPAAAKSLMAKVKLQEGDVLMSRSGSLGVVCVVEKAWVHSLISSHLIILRIADKTITSYFLALFLSSIAGRMQIEKNSNGGVQPEINHAALKSILVPKLDMETQTQIANLVQQSFALKAQSERLLETAKRAVEIAIETDEQTALAFIEAQI